MTHSKDQDPYANPRAFYGAELRRLREDAGLTQAQLGMRAFCSGSYIGQFEAVLRRPQVDLSRTMDEVLGSGKHLQRLAKLARASKVAEYFADAASLEPLAKTISEYAPVLVPGLLQTEEYARALTRTANPYASDEYVEDLVRARMDRQKILNSPTAPVLWAILHEAVLLAPMGGAMAMRRQLAHIAELARKPNVVVQVLPFAAMAEAHMASMTSIMSFHDAPPIVYTEGAGSGSLIDDPALVEQNARAYDLARAAAMSPATSLALLASMAKDDGNT